MKKLYSDPQFEIVSLTLREAIASGYNGSQYVNESSALYGSGETDIPIIQPSEDFEL